MAEYTFSKIKRGSNLYILKDAGAARQEHADWNTNNGVKNLLDCIKNGYLYPYSGGGITVIVDKLNGTATINGTATRQISFYIQRGSLDTSKKFKLTGCPAGGNYASGYSLYAAAGATTYAIDDGNGVEFSPQAGHTDIRVLIRSGTTLDNVIFKPMLRPAFIEDDTFTPYSMSNLELTQKLSSYYREYSPSTSDDEAANITEGILTTYAAGLAGKSDGSFCVLRTYAMDTPSVGASKRIQIAEFADGTRKTRTYSNNAWSAWV